MKELQEAAGLFEVNVPDFKQLKMCRREIGLLKGLWDMIMIIKSSFEDWNTTLWKDINVENMEMDCKKFVKVSNTWFLSSSVNLTCNTVINGRKSEPWIKRCEHGTHSLVWIPLSKIW